MIRKNINIFTTIILHNLIIISRRNFLDGQYAISSGRIIKTNKFNRFNHSTIMTYQIVYTQIVNDFLFILTIIYREHIRMLLIKVSKNFTR